MRDPALGQIASLLGELVVATLRPRVAFGPMGDDETALFHPPEHAVQTARVDVNLAEALEWRDKSREAGLNDPSLDYLSNAGAPPKPNVGK